MAYARSRGPTRIRFDEGSFQHQERIRQDRTYSLGTDDGEDESIDRFRTRSSLSESFAHDSLEDLNTDDMRDESMKGQREWMKRCVAASRGRLRSSVRWAVPLLLVAGLSGGLLEYRRLNRRAAGFDKAWNPITESFTQFYEGEKKASKQALFKTWHGASASSEGHFKESPSLGDLLSMPSKYPFTNPAAAIAHSSASPLSKGLPSLSSPRRLADVTLVLNHWARNTLATQLSAVMASSVLPQQVWVCLFAVQGPSKEAAYRQTVDVWAPRFEAAGSALHHATSSFNFKFFGRFQLALQAPTTYVWLVDDDVVPGLRFLEALLHVAGTGHYNGVLGATGWLFPPPQATKQGFLRSSSSSSGMTSMPGAGSEVIDYRDPTLHGGLYIPDDRYNISVTKLTEVDVLCSQWFLKTNHVKLLFRETAPTWATGEDMALSYALRKFAGLPSYVMPIALSNENTWGNAAPEAHTTGNVEASIQGTGSGMVAARNEVWSMLMSRGAVPLRLSLARQQHQYSSMDNRHTNAHDDDEEKESNEDDDVYEHLDNERDGNDRTANRSGRSGVDSRCGGEFVMLSMGSTEEATFMRPYFEALTALECGVLLFLSVDHPHDDFSTALKDTPRRSPFTASSVTENDRRRKGRRSTISDVHDDDDEGALGVTTAYGVTGLGMSGLGGGGGLQQVALAAAASSEAADGARRRRNRRPEVTCAHLLEALGAPLIWCSSNHFGIFRVKRSHSLMSLSMPRGSSALEQVHTTGYTTGGFEDIVASLFATMTRLKPISVLWCAPPRTAKDQSSINRGSANSKMNGVVEEEPLHQALELVVPQLHGQPSSSSINAGKSSDSNDLPIDVPWRVRGAHKAVQSALRTAAEVTSSSVNDSRDELAVRAWYLPGSRGDRHRLN